MDLLEAIKGRRSVRKFRAEPVEDAHIEQIMEAGRAAPSWANTQCWEVVLVRDANTKRRLAATLSATNPARQAMEDAPVVIAACGRKGSSGFKRGEQTTVLGDWLMFDVALFIQNATLAAHALGYGSVHVGLFDHNTVAQILGLPEDVQIVELLPLGRPVEPAGSGPRRREIADFVHEEHF